MKSVRKNLSMSKMLGSFRKRKDAEDGGNTSGSDASPPVASLSIESGSPEATAHNNAKAFCEAGGNAENEILFLPSIVDAAESSPAAAAECAHVIRKFLSKRYYSYPAFQLNALMLVRILADNPGITFTRALDQQFTEAARKLLLHGKDDRVRQMLMETLTEFETNRMYDDTLKPLITMWKTEKEGAQKQYGIRPPLPHRRSQQAPAMNHHSQNSLVRGSRPKQLPDPAELAGRLEEARSSANLLEQVVMNTPVDEMLNNELINEFAERCRSASASLQGYMQSENPAPDNDTMETLIDTNEQLQTALSQHQRAVLNARKQLGVGPNNTSDNAPAAANEGNRVLEWTRSQQELFSTGDHNPPLPERPEHPEPVNNGKGKATADPFADPEPRQEYPPFSPDFHTTTSYINRQESAAANLTMHGAISDGNRPSGSQPRNNRPQEDDDDIYDATPRITHAQHKY